MKTFFLAMLFIPVLCFSQTHYHHGKVVVDHYYIHIVVDTNTHEIAIREFINGKHDIIIENGDSTTTNRIHFGKKYVFYYKNNETIFTIKGKNTELVYTLNK
jgi:hypothetical protein